MAQSPFAKRVVTPDPQWSDRTVTPASFGTGEAAEAQRTQTSPNSDSPFARQVVSPDGTPGVAAAQDMTWSTATGQNLEGPTNAFDTTFWKKAREQDEAQGDRGLRDRWTRPDATGVVMYNDAEQDLAFGDVFVDGKKQGNMRAGYAGLDPEQSRQMLARLALPREVWAKAYETESGKPMTGAGTVDEELKRVESENTENYAKGLSAEDFEAAVAERAEGHLQSGWGQFWNLAGSALGGGLTGAGVASVIPGVGTVAGFIGGTIAGSVGGLLNRDEQARAVAQAQEQLAMAQADGHTAIGIGDALSGYAGAVGSTLNPARNITHGVYDQIAGDVGDAKSAYYDSEHGLLMAAVDTAALVVDGVGSFGTGLGRKAFTAAMGAGVIGQGTSVAAGAMEGNIAFNPYTGTYEDIGVMGTLQRTMSVGIDAAQTGAARGVSRIVDPVRKGGPAQSAGGFRIATNEAGETVTTRWSASALIPSELATGLSARMLARRQLRKEGVEASADNMARATARQIDNLTAGTNTIATAMVNGFGEGAEEFVQAALDASAFGETPTFAELFDAARQGFGMGVGMGTAIGRSHSSASDKYYERSVVIRAMNGEEIIPAERWAKMSLQEKAVEGTVSDETQRALYDAAVTEMHRQGAKVAVANIPELRRAYDVVRQWVAQQTTNSETAVEPSRLQTHAGPEWGPQDYVVSLEAALSDVRTRVDLMEQVATGQARNREGQALPVTPEQREQAAAIAGTDRRLLATMENVRSRLLATDDTDVAGRASMVRELNEVLKQMWHADQSTGLEAYGARRSASVWGARFPLNAAGSFQLLRLQISPDLTENGVNNNAQVPDEILAPTGGDYDGDRIVHLLRDLIPDEQYTALRYGAGQLTSDGVMIPPKTYTVGYVEQLYDALAKPGSTAFHAAAQMQTRLRRGVTGILEDATMMPADVRRRLVTDLVDGLSARDPKATNRFMDTLATNHAPAMRELAEKIDGSPYLAIARLVDNELMQFASAAALRAPERPERVVQLPATRSDMPQWRNRRLSQASQIADAMFQLDKSDAFRTQTVLKYNPRREATETAPQELDSQIAGQTRIFTLLNDGLASPGEDAMFEGTLAQERALNWLNRVAISDRESLGAHTTGEAMVLLAGAQVADLTDGGRAPRSDGEVTFVQAVLHEVINGLRRSYEPIINSDAALASRLSSLDALTAPNYTTATGSRHASGGDAFVEVFGAHPIYELLGDQGTALTTYTVRGLRDTLVSMRYDVRREFEEALKAHPSYTQDREAPEGVNPFSPYRVLVDNVMESAHQQLTEVDGLARGALARSSETASENFRTLHDRIRKLAGLAGRKLTDDASVRDYLATRGDFADLVLKLMDANSTRAGTRNVDPTTGKITSVEFPQWIYEVLAEPNTARAEMALLRNTLFFNRAALAARPEKIDVHRVNDRILRLWMQLDYAANDMESPTMPMDRVAFRRFTEILNDPTMTVDAFMRELNSDPRFRRENDAPYLPWARDRSVVEASRHGKGVSDVLEGTEMRDAMRDAAAAAAAELRNAEAVNEYLAANAELLDKLDRAQDPKSMEHDFWKRFEAWVNLSKQLPTLVGASVWLQQAKHINEIQGNMGVKGISPDNVAPLGRAISAQLPTFDSAVGQVVASATSGSMGEILTDMTVLARTDREIVLEDGTVVNWQALTASDALRLLRNPKTVGLAARVLGLTAWDYNDDTGANSLSSVFGAGVAAMAADPAVSIFGNSTQAKLRRLMILEGKATRPGGTPIIPVLLAQQMNVREAASDHVIGAESPERERMAMEILEDIADVLQSASTLETLYVPGKPDELTLVADDGPEGATVGRGFQTPGGTGLPVTIINRSLLRTGRQVRRMFGGGGNLMAKFVPAAGELRDIALTLLETWQANFAAHAVASGNEGLMEIAKRTKKDLERLDDYTSPLDVLLDTYSRYNDQGVRELLMRHLRAYGDIARATPWAASEIQRALNPESPQLTYPDGTVLPDLTSDEWEMVARSVIAFTMHTTYGLAASSDTQVALFPSLKDPDSLDGQRSFWDPTFVDIGLDILAPNVMRNHEAALSPLLAAQMDLVREMGANLPSTTAEKFEQSVRKLIQPKRTNEETGATSGTTGPWHAHLPALLHSGVGAVLASAAETAVKMAGINPARLRMLGATTVQDWSQRPDDAELSSTAFSAEQLTAVLDEGVELDSRVEMTIAVPGGQAVVGERPFAQLEGRVVREVSVTLPDGTVVPILGHPRYSVGLLLPTSTGVAATDGGVISLKTLGEVVGDLLVTSGVKGDAWSKAKVNVRFFHPETKTLTPLRGTDAYSHNPWFDGVNGRTDAAFAQRSLLGSFFFGTDGVIPAAYETALSAIKKLTFALQQVTTMPEAVRKAWAVGGLTDMAGMLHNMTAFTLKQKIDGKELGAERYNAVHKLFSLLYVVRYIDETGAPQVLSAEQVIARQLRGEVFTPDNHAQVIGLPLEHVLVLMGESDLATPVVTPFGEMTFSVDVDRAKPYTNFPSEAWTTVLPGFAGGGAVETAPNGKVLGWATRDLLSEPKLLNQRIPSHRVVAPTSRPKGDATDFYRKFRAHQDRVQSARMADPVGTGRWATIRETTKSRVLDQSNIGRQALQAVQAAGTGDYLSSARLLAPKETDVTSTYDTTTAFMYQHRGVRKASAIDGVLTWDGLGDGSAGDAALGDTVYVPAETFLQAEVDRPTEEVFAEAREVLDKLMDVGANIGLPPSPTAGLLRGQLASYLRERGYVSSQENGDLFEPRPTAARSRAEAAFASSLTATTWRTSRNRVPMFLSNHYPITENSVYSVNGGIGALEDYYVRELAQTGRYAGYVPPVDPQARVEVVAALQLLLRKQAGREYLATLSDVAGLDTSTETGKATAAEAAADLQRAIEDLIRRLERAGTNERASLLPEPGEEFGTGDIIPLVSYDRDGNLIGIHLHRHGHVPVHEKHLNGAALPEGNQALGIRYRLTIDQPKIDDTHTTHRGVLVERQWLGLNGFVARVRVKLADLGSKVFETHTGMKWTTTTMEGLEVPKHSIFAGRPVLGVSDLASPKAKTSEGWWQNTPSQIIESVGFDTMPFLVRALTGSDTVPGTQEYGAAESMVRDILNQVRADLGGTIDPVSVVSRSTTELQTIIVDLLQKKLNDMLSDQAPVLGQAVDPSRAGDLTMLRMVLTAIASGAQVSEVLGAPGYLYGSEVSHTMHPVFTTMLHQLPIGHPARTAFVQQINDRMPKDPVNEIDRYELNPDFTWSQHTLLSNGQEQVITGMLSFAEVRNNEHNDALAEQARGRKQRSDASATTNSMAHLAWDLSVLSDRVHPVAADVLGINEFVHTEEGVRTLAFRSGLQETTRSTRSDDYLPPTEAELEHLQLRALPSAAALRVLIDDSGWYKDQSKTVKLANQRKYRQARETAQRLLGLSDMQSAYMDELIRSVVARPAGVADRDQQEFLTYREAMAALRLLTSNAKAHTLPTHRGAVPIRREVLLAMRRGGFVLHRSPDSKVPVESWNGWVDVLLSSAFSSDPELRGYPAVSNMIDGVMHSYRDDVKGLPATMSPERAARLQQLQTDSGMVVASPILRRRFKAPMIQDGLEVSDLEDLEAAGAQLDLMPQDVRAIIERRMTAWENRTGIGGRRRQSPRAEAVRGAQIREELARNGMLIRMIQLGYVLKTMINPGLYVSAFLEYGQRSMQERIVSALTGSNVASNSAFVKMFGTPQLTPAQRKQWTETVNSLAGNAHFYQMVFGNTNFQQADAQGSGEARLQRWTNKATAAINDPTWGTKSHKLAERFMEAAWETLSKQQMDRHIPIEQFLEMAATNPERLEMLSPDAVQHGYRRIEHTRNLQDNLLERMRRQKIESFIANGGPARNALGTVLLRLPTLFFRFRSNTLINMMGLQAPFAVFTTIMSDRTKRDGGFKDHLRGEGLDFDTEITDQARIEDSLDLTRAIVRSGVSHTQLFVLGSLLGSFSGDDDDTEKLLNKLRRYQEVPVANDPLALENDFRNAEAWFNGLLPAGMGVPTWMMKMFVSPAMGIARFQDTGDSRQVFWGFMDALGSMPLLNLDTVNNSWMLANEMFQAAEAESMSGNIEATNRASKLMIAGLATLEGMLFESAFASMVYQAGDEWDRDPYKLPQVENGEIVRDKAYNQPQATEVLEDYIDPDTGEPKKGYVTRRDRDAQLHAIGETRPVFATVMSLIMRDKTYIRYNMVPKIRTVKSEALTEDEAKKIIVSIYNNETGQEELTLEGAEGIVRGIHLGALTADSPALQNVFIPYEMRSKLQVQFLEELTQKYIDLGYGKKDALYAAKDEYYGQGYGEEEGFGIGDIINGTMIPTRQDQKYMQLNTTYVMGPTGRPIATGLQRSVLASVGQPFEEFHTGATSNMSVDQLLNSVDDVRGANLGMRALVKMDESWEHPTAEEIGESIEKALEDLGKRIEDAVKPENEWTPFRYGRYRRSGGWGGGGGGRGYYQGRGFTASWGGDDAKVFAPRRIEAPRADDLYSINTSNAIIRRATIRRERFSSQRGRLNQWQ